MRKYYLVTYHLSKNKDIDDFKQYANNKKQEILDATSDLISYYLSSNVHLIMSKKDKDYIISRYKQLLEPSDTLLVVEVKRSDFIQSSKGLKKFFYDIEMLDDEESEENIKEETLFSPDDYDMGLIIDGLKKYSRILDVYNKTKDVSNDPDFQRMYDAFYRVRRNEEWRKYYFKLMQEARTKEMSFEDILTLICDNTGNIEASFSSKLLSTINPNMPIWDQYVLMNLGLKPTPQYMEKDVRLICSVDIYNSICEWYNGRINSEIGKKELEFFNKSFPRYTWISDVKKIDFLLWSKRK